MKCVILLALCAAFAFVRAVDYNCHCSVVLIGDGNVLVAFEDLLLAQTHENCYEEDECANKCYETLMNGTNGGDLNFSPPELGGHISVGDYGCQLFGVDIHDGKGYGYSKLCNHRWINTNFTFKGSFCCEDGKHTQKHEHCG